MARESNRTGRKGKLRTYRFCHGCGQELTPAQVGMCARCEAVNAAMATNCLEP